MQLLRLDWNILFTIINLLVLYLAMKHFLIGPVTGIIEKRRNAIDAQFSDARDRKEEADRMKLQYEEKLKEANGEAAQIIDRARCDAGEVYGKRLAEADAQAKKVLAEGNKTLELERAKMEQELRGQIAELALAAAQKIMMEKSNEATDKALYDRFLAEAGELHDADGA